MAWPILLPSDKTISSTVIMLWAFVGLTVTEPTTYAHYEKFLYTRRLYGYKTSNRTSELRIITTAPVWEFGPEVFTGEQTDIGSDRTLIYHSGPRISDTNAIIPQEHLAYNFMPTGVYIHSDDQIPLCNAKLVLSLYSWSKVESKRICNQAFTSADCKLLTHKVVTTTYQWLEKSVEIVCAGLKGNINSISRGKEPNWLPVYYSTPSTFLTLAGEPMYVKYLNGTYAWITPAALSMGLTVANNRLRGLILDTFTYEYVPLTTFVLATAHSQTELIAQMRPYTSRTCEHASQCLHLPTNYAGAATDCDRVLRTLSMTKVLGVNYKDFNKVSYCEPQPSEDFALIHEFEYTTVREENLWYEAVAQKMLGGVLTWTDQAWREVNMGDAVIAVLIFHYLSPTLGLVMTVLSSIVIVYYKNHFLT